MENRLWAAANSLRGTVDAADFKVLGAWVVAHTDDDNAPQGGVGLTVSALVESVMLLLS